MIYNHINQYRLMLYAGGGYSMKTISITKKYTQIISSIVIIALILMVFGCSAQKKLEKKIVGEWRVYGSNSYTRATFYNNGKGKFNSSDFTYEFRTIDGVNYLTIRVEPPTSLKDNPIAILLESTDYTYEYDSNRDTWTLRDATRPRNGSITLTRMQ